MLKAEVQELFESCVSEIKALGYDLPKVFLSLDYNSVKVMGVCIKKTGSDFFIIKVSKFHWENNGPEEIKNTIMHELTHAIDRNKHSHDFHWAKLAREVSLQTGTNITMYAAHTEGEDKASMQRAVAYVDCNKCNHRHYIFKRTKVYKTQAGGYHCSSCGPSSKLTFVKLK
jgi:predicted SprT family Zn-dependent metalloprotease